MGPMRAACRFARGLEEAGQLDRVARVQVDLYGSLALTGMGHATDRAVLLGLAGNEPAAIDPAAIDSTVAAIRASRQHRPRRKAAPSHSTRPATSSFIATRCFLPARTPNIPTAFDSPPAMPAAQSSPNARSSPSAADLLPKMEQADLPAR